MEGVAQLVEALKNTRYRLFLDKLTRRVAEKLPGVFFNTRQTGQIQ
jgi:hypothetical protein